MVWIFLLEGWPCFWISSLPGPYANILPSSLGPIFFVNLKLGGEVNSVLTQLKEIEQYQGKVNKDVPFFQGKSYLRVFFEELSKSACGKCYSYFSLKKIFGTIVYQIFVKKPKWQSMKKKILQWMNCTKDKQQTARGVISLLMILAKLADQQRNSKHVS